ncbi:MAG: DUF11 domain-containing protein [Planctomycetales bacterium]|nr:DUF11 domain-containing protein [Planctomycetales bacterium]
MKRNLLRATALTAVLAMGLGGAYLFRHGLPAAEAGASTPDLMANVELPTGDPLPIENAETPILLAANTPRATDEENPLREAPVGRNRRAAVPAQYAAPPRDVAAEPRRLNPVADARPINAQAAAGGVVQAQYEEAAQPAALLEADSAIEGPAGPLPPASLRENAAPPRAIGEAAASRYGDSTPRYDESTPSFHPGANGEIPDANTLPLDSPTGDLGSSAGSQELPLATATARDRLLSPADARFPGAASDEGLGRPGSKSLEGAQSPTLMIQKTAPAEIQVGKQCQFQIIVRNAGQTTAHGVVVHDTVPAGTRFVSAEPGVAQGPEGSLVWKLGDLEAGRDAKINLMLMPTAEGEIGSVATVQFQAQASVRTKATKPELELRLTGPESVMIGGKVKLGIEISNPGSGSATGVMLLENVPEGANHPAGKSLEFEVGTLAAGESRKMELTLTAEQAGRLENVLIATADANLEVSERVQFDVVAPELVVAIDGPSRRFLERPATYTLSIQNPGTAAAKDILLTSYLPKGMKFVEANNAGTYDPKTHSVSWGLEELPAQQAGNVELVAIPMEAGQQTLRVEGKAQQGLSDKQEQEVLVEGIAAILFEVIDLEDPVEVGGETAYEIRVVNQGSKAATNVQVAVLLPPDMQAVSADGPTREQLEAGRILFAPLEKLAPKADTSYTVRVKALRAGDQRVRVQVDTDETRSPVTKEESTRVYSDE